MSEPTKGDRELAERLMRNSTPLANACGTCGALTPTDIENEVAMERLYPVVAEEIAAHLEPEREAVRRLVAATKALAAALHAIDGSDSARAIYQMAAIHGMWYEGPTYEHELIAAVEALTALPAELKGES